MGQIYRNYYIINGKIEGGTKGWEVLREAVTHREKSDTGRPGIPKYFQHCSGRSDEFGSAESLWTPGGILWFCWASDEQNIVFYMNDGKIEGRKSIWVHTILIYTERMFERVVLKTNTGKTKSMVCTPGFIWGQHKAAA